VTDCCTSSAKSWREHVTFRLDDFNVNFVLDQHA
jgi:hypothetical protein